MIELPEAVTIATQLSKTITSKKKALYRAVKDTIEQAIRQNGRASERDIFDKPGNYSPVMDRYAVDKPCPNCGKSIQKISYLGGSCYICPACQM